MPEIPRRPGTYRIVVSQSVLQDSNVPLVTMITFVFDCGHEASAECLVEDFRGRELRCQKCSGSLPFDLNQKSRPCWMFSRLNRTTPKEIWTDATYIYFKLKDDPLLYRVTLDQRDTGSYPNLWAPNGFTLPRQPTEILINIDGPAILVLDVQWFENLQVHHDGLARRECDGCHGIWLSWQK